MGLFSGSKSKTRTVPVDLLSREQHELLSDLTDLYRETSAGDYTSPPMNVPVTGREEDYYKFIDDLAQSTAMRNIVSGKVPYEVGNEAAGRLYEQTIRPEYLRNLEEVVMPAIQEGYAGPTYYGSSRGRAMTRAAEDTAQKLSEAYANLMYNEELARRGAVENAYNRVLPGAQYMTGELGRAGELARTIAQEKVAADLQKYLMGEAVPGEAGQIYQNPIYDPSVALAMNLLGIRTHGIGTKTTSGGPGLGYSLAGGLFKGLGGALGGMAAGGTTTGG
ncbi:MAG: hypothetical protein OCU18_03905 [Candidatus Syntrophoarchaeum sp.]|nr:hypothetical protein [Candidatus Syntrophoarchaeum sp.]